MFLWMFEVFERGAVGNFTSQDFEISHRLLYTFMCIGYANSAFMSICRLFRVVLSCKV